MESLKRSYSKFRIFRNHSGPEGVSSVVSTLTFRLALTMVVCLSSVLPTANRIVMNGKTGNKETKIPALAHLASCFSESAE